MSFFKQLSRGANNFFGRQLPSAMVKFGRQLSTGSNRAGGWLNKGTNFLNKLERVPVIGDIARPFTGVAKGVLGVGKNLTDIGSAGGAGIGALARRDWNGALNAGKSILNEARDTGRLAGSVGADAMKLAPMFI